MRLPIAPEQILSRPEDPLSALMTYVVMRNGIGALGLAFPIVLLVGGGIDHVQGSLSAYYHFTPESPARYGAGIMRDAFVGMLCAIGAFLLFYRGHSVQEDLALNLAGVSAALIALAPMDWPEHAARVTAAGRIHSVAAATFFVMIGYVCVFRAQDTLCIVRETALRRRFSRVYLALGLLMLATPVAVGAIELAAPGGAAGHATILVEVPAVVVFAAYWLIKSFEIRTSLRRA